MKRSHPHPNSVTVIESMVGLLAAIAIGALAGLVVWSWLLSGVAQ